MSLLLARLSGGAAASAAPGWEAQPSFVSGSKRIAVALAALTLTAGIEQVFVPPVVQASTWGFEAQPQPVAKKPSVRFAHDSLAYRSSAVAFGFDAQPQSLAKRPSRVTANGENWPLDLKALTSSTPFGFDGQPQRLSKRPTPAATQDSLPPFAASIAFGWQEQPASLVKRRNLGQSAEGWPLDVTVTAAATVTWGYDSQPPLVRVSPRVAPALDGTPFAVASVAFTWEGQPALVRSRPRLSQISGDVLPPFEAAAAAGFAWWGEWPAAAVRSRFWIAPVPTEAFLVGDAAVPPGDIELGGGGFIDWRNAPSQGRDRRWKKRKADLEKIDQLLYGIVAQIPADAPEIVTVDKALAVVERAAVKLIAPVFDNAALSADINRAHASLTAAQATLDRYLAQVEDDDDDDFLLLS